MDRGHVRAAGGLLARRRDGLLCAHRRHRRLLRRQPLPRGHLRGVPLGAAARRRQGRRRRRGGRARRRPATSRAPRAGRRAATRAPLRPRRRPRRLDGGASGSSPRNGGGRGGGGGGSCDRTPAAGTCRAWIGGVVTSDWFERLDRPRAAQHGADVHAVRWDERGVRGDPRARATLITWIFIWEMALSSSASAARSTGPTGGTARRHDREPLDRRHDPDGGPRGVERQPLLPAHAAHPPHAAAAQEVEGAVQDHRHVRQGDAADGQHLRPHVPHPRHLLAARHAALRRHVRGGRRLRRREAALPLRLLRAGDDHVLRAHDRRVGRRRRTRGRGRRARGELVLRRGRARRLLRHHEPLHRDPPQRLRRGGGGGRGRGGRRGRRGRGGGGRRGRCGGGGRRRGGRRRTRRREGGGGGA